MNKLLTTTILATSLFAAGAMAQTTPPAAPAGSPPAATAPAAVRLPPAPLASLDGISANEVIGAAVRTHVADASRTVGSTAPRTAPIPPAATTGASGATTGAPATATGSTTGTVGTVSPSAPAATTTATAPAVDTRNTDRIGKVHDLILGKGGVDQLIVSVGGVMGIGDKLYSLPFDKATFVRDGNDVVVMVPMSEAELKGLPEYKKPVR